MANEFAHIAAKMVKALAAIDAVEKRGRNTAQGYGYVKATDVANEVRNALHEAGVAFTYQVLTERFWETERVKDGKVVGSNYFCSLHVQGTFTDAETGESLSSSAIGWGADTQDKAPYKAMTGALKYLLRTTFLIPDELDPENDALEKKVKSEIERQKAVAIPGANATLTQVITQTIPPELDWSYVKSTGVLICRIVSAMTRKRKTGGGEYLTMELNQQVETSKLATYFHNSHRAELLAAVGKVCKFMVSMSKDGKFVNIDEVLEIDGKHIDKAPDPAVEQKARLLASVLDLDGEQLREMFSRYCESSWEKTLIELERMKAMTAGVSTEEEVPF